MTQTYKTTLLKADDGVAQAVSLLQQGECVALPTETVYGLAADASSSIAVNRIFEAKGRPKNHPLIVHLPSLDHLDDWAVEIPEVAYRLAKSFWPGPITFLLKKADHVPHEVTGGLDTIALRVPAHPLFLQVLTQLNRGLAAPSANRYKQLSPTIAEQVMRELGGRVSAVLDGGSCAHGLESTILDLVSTRPRILRAGPVTQQQLIAEMGQNVDLPNDHLEQVPGNIKAHYQPNTPLVIVATEQILSLTHDVSIKHYHCIVWSDAAIEHCSSMNIPTSQWTALASDAPSYGRDFYLSLYRADQRKASQIMVEEPPELDAWAAVNDRLSRAAAR